MTYASFALQVGCVMQFSPHMTFYYHIPDTYRQKCALCEMPLSSDDQHTLLICPVPELSSLIARQQTTATVAAFLNGSPVIGGAHNRCISLDFPNSNINFPNVFSYFQQATPYYTYAAQFLRINFYLNKGHVQIQDEQCRVLLHARDQWVHDRTFSPDDPQKWVWYTLITTLVESYYGIPRTMRVPIWDLVVPSTRQNDKSLWEEYIARCTKYMNYCTQWSDDEARSRFYGPLQYSAIYPIVDYTCVFKNT